jgi:hypothetical protein
VLGDQAGSLQCSDQRKRRTLTLLFRGHAQSGSSAPTSPDAWCLVVIWMCVPSPEPPPSQGIHRGASRRPRRRQTGTRTGQVRVHLRDNRRPSPTAEETGCTDYGLVKRLQTTSGRSHPC